MQATSVASGESNSREPTLGALSPGADPAVASLFDSESARYDRVHDHPLGYTLRARLAVVLDLLGEGPGDVFDAGMGPGRLCAELELRGWTAAGVDISEQMVALAAARMPHARERLLQGSIDDLPFEDSSFDAVVSTGVLEYLQDPAAGVAEFVRIMRPGALVVMSIPNPRSVHGLWQAGVWYPAIRGLKRALPRSRRPAPYRRPSTLQIAEFERMLADAGLRPVSVRHTGAAVLPTPFDRAVPRLAARMAARVEPPRTALARTLATQFVVAARKPGGTSPASGSRGDLSG